VNNYNNHNRLAKFQSFFERIIFSIEVEHRFNHFPMSIKSPHVARERSSDNVDRVTGAATDCCQCVGDSFLATWHCIKASTMCVWTFVSTNICCMKNEDDRKSRKTVKKITQSRLGQPHENPESMQLRKFKSKLAQQSKITQNEATAPPDQLIGSAQASGHATSLKEASSTSKERRHIATSELPDKHVPDSQPAPPRIDFVETGSIFGHRKRHSMSNLLLLDNGRFRSPGKPNVTVGPGGRAIRLSFQTGFPSIKSVESRASLPIAKTVDSKPNEPDLTTNPPGLNPVEE
jgi:hypothetical protein